MTEIKYTKIQFAPDIESNFTASSYQQGGPIIFPKVPSFNPSKYYVKYVNARNVNNIPKSILKLDFTVVPRKNLRAWCAALIVLALYSLWSDYWDVNGKLKHTIHLFVL